MPSIDVAQPPVAPPITQEEEESAPIQPIVGIIYPPPEVRNIVDKTASFVARNGPEFESRIRQNELGNPKFNFLNAGDPYNAYYQHKVKEIKEGKGDVQSVQPAPPPPGVKTVATSTQQKQQEILKQIEQQFEPKDPPAEFEFLSDPPSISALDLDIVRLTAQFVARNGRTFLTNLMNREQRNFQFDFLRPQHSLFQYFTKLLEQYTKILIPPKDLMGKLKEEGASASHVLEQVKYRADWIKHQEAQRRKEELALEKERVAYAQIDWHDFVVVETVDYMPGEVGNFPPPTTPDEVGARVLMQERMADAPVRRVQEEEMEVPESSDEEESEEETEETPPTKPAAPPAPPIQPAPATPAPPTTTPTPAPAAPATADKGAADNNQVQDMEEESSSESEDEEKSSEPQAPGTGQVKLKNPLAPPNPEKVIIKKYNPKAPAAVKPAAKPADDYLISPINGERIPASKVHEHMRINLLDPRWVEQRDKNIMDRINQENVYAPGAAIEASLKQLAERRTDIFGVGDEETAIGKKIGEEDKKKDDKVTWDGYTSSVEAATRAARANITIEEQIHQIHKVKGLLPDEEKEKIGPKPAGKGGSSQQQQPPLPTAKPPTAPPPPPVAPPPPPQPPMLPPPPPQPPIMMVPAPIRPPLMVTPGGFPVVAGGGPFMAPPGTQPVPPPQPPQPQPTLGLTGLKHVTSADQDEEPPSKKLKSEDSLVPEAEFLANNKSPVNFKVIIPMMTDKSEWRLNGQTLSLTMSLTDTVSTLKGQLQEATGMPLPKQKLQSEGLFFKDSNTLAYYNVLPTTVIHLVVKERGGRKK